MITLARHQPHHPLSLSSCSVWTLLPLVVYLSRVGRKTCCRAMHKLNDIFHLLLRQGQSSITAINNKSHNHRKLASSKATTSQIFVSLQTKSLIEPLESPTDSIIINIIIAIVHDRRIRDGANAHYLYTYSTDPRSQGKHQKMRNDSSLSSGSNSQVI